MSEPKIELTPEQIAEAMRLRDESSRRIEKLFKFIYGHRVRHDEVGAQGIMQASAWHDLLQLARGEYFRNLGLFIEGSEAPVQVIVRRAVIDHLAFAKYDQPIIVRMRCSRLGESSIKFEYLIDDTEGLRLAIAETIMSCVQRDPIRAIPMPFSIRDRVVEFEGEALVNPQGL
ncbi:MAG: acyl-CoA thioesterase [Deltaproteobacteria bacterium]|nr:acyl-CoA thioesterase [Deltaproteobacteria bacterium]